VSELEVLLQLSGYCFFKYLHPLLRYEKFCGDYINAEKNLLTCILFELHDSNYFEESFTGDEYPSISFSQNKDRTFSLSIGASGYESNEENVVISHKYGKNEIGSEPILWHEMTAKVAHSPTYREEFILRVETNYKSAKASLIVNETSVLGKKVVTRKVLIADLACSGAFISY